MYAAVDVGGTKTLVAVVDSKGKVLERVKFPTPEEYDDFKTQLADVVAKLSTKRFSNIVIALPGRINRQRGIGIRMGNLNWRNIPIQTDVEKIFDTTVLVENDAKLAGLSEALILKDKYSKVLYVTISTGIGLGLIVDGQIDADMSDSGGNSVMLEHKGKTVSWESFASGKAIVQRYGKRASEIEDKQVWKVIAKDFAAGLITVIAMMDPEVVVIGGGVGSHFDKYGLFLKEYLHHYETPMMPIPPIVKAKHPEEAVIYGCYEFAKQKSHGKPAS